MSKGHCIIQQMHFVTGSEYTTTSDCVQLCFSRTAMARSSSASTEKLLADEPKQKQQETCSVLMPYIIS